MCSSQPCVVLASFSWKNLWYKVFLKTRLPTSYCYVINANNRWFWLNHMDWWGTRWTLMCLWTHYCAWTSTEMLYVSQEVALKDGSGYATLCKFWPKSVLNLTVLVCSQNVIWTLLSRVTWGRSKWENIHFCFCWYSVSDARFIIKWYRDCALASRGSKPEKLHNIPLNWKKIKQWSTQLVIFLSLAPQKLLCQKW